MVPIKGHNLRSSISKRPARLCTRGRNWLRCQIQLQWNHLLLITESPYSCPGIQGYSQSSFSSPLDKFWAIPLGFDSCPFLLIGTSVAAWVLPLRPCQSLRVSILNLPPTLSFPTNLGGRDLPLPPCSWPNTLMQSPSLPVIKAIISFLHFSNPQSPRNSKSFIFVIICLLCSLKNLIR